MPIIIERITNKAKTLKPELIHDYLTESAKQCGDKSFIICGSKKFSFQEIDDASTSLACQLIDLGLHPQDKVAVLLDNSAETVIALYAISKAAGTFVVINSTVKAGKLSYILNNSNAKILITHTAKARIVLQAMNICDEKPPVIWVTPTGNIPLALKTETQCYNWNELTSQANANPSISLPRANEKDLAALIYTSGSTGQPKGVMQPHDKMIGVANSIIQYLGNEHDDVILNVLSLSFGYGLYQVLMAAIFGGTIVLEKGFVYLHDTLRKISVHHVTALPVVPTVLAMMLKLQDIEEYDFSSLKYITNAGAALPVRYTRQLRKLIPHAHIYPMYGQTECVRTCYLRPEYIDERPDSVGFEIPNCKVWIADENGHETGPDEVGELVVTGANVMDGYYKDPELTAQVFRPGPQPGQVHLYSGDFFRRDKEGFLYFVSRKGDMIKTRGERVSPLEVENLLLQIDGISETAVIGVPDEIFGQVVKAFVTLDEGCHLTDMQILKQCSEIMENYMVPKYIEIVEALPKTPNGKIDKKQLKEREESNS